MLPSTFFEKSPEDTVLLLYFCPNINKDFSTSQVVGWISAAKVRSGNVITNQSY